MVDEITNQLVEWSINYVKNRDLLHKKLVSHKTDSDKVVFEFKDKKHTYLATKELTTPKPTEEFFTIVTLNTKNNVDFLYKNWESFKKNPKLSIIFVNLKNHEKWVILPSTHDKITEKASLKLGLISMMEQAGEV